MVVTCAQMKETEEALFATGVPADPLMELAGLGCVRAIRQLFPTPGHAILFVGKGHNAGDAYVIGRHLRRAGWEVAERLAHSPSDLAPLTARKRHRFLQTPGSPAEPISPAPLVAIDGLLGIGASGPLRGAFAALAREMETLRSQSGACVIALDIPSGLDGDSGIPHPGAVRADVTLTIACVKQGLLADSALDHVGRLILIPVPQIQPSTGNSNLVTLHALGLAPLLPPPPFSQHKISAGRVGLIAGSAAYSGAPVLSSLGALRAGGGLIHLFCPRPVHPLIAPRCPPEVILRPFDHLGEIHDVPLDALGIGPGLSGIDDAEMLAFLQTDPRPLVLDAEALNTLARHDALPRLAGAPASRLLTPHPGEMRRLVPSLDASLSRVEVARSFVASHPFTLLFKGSRTIIAERNRPVSFNTTGHPGMATGGVGDVLTGILAAFLARGIPAYDAACLGSWLIGHAAELFLAGGSCAPEGLAASEIAQHLPKAIAGLRRGVF